MAEERQLHIKVKNSGGDEVTFKVKPDTAFHKIFGAYAAQKGVDPESLTFLFDGKRVKGTETPKMLELEDEDMLDVTMAQVGGGSMKNDT